jgi:tetratricopeptide (TPR) repeat protein
LWYVGFGIRLPASMAGIAVNQLPESKHRHPKSETAKDMARLYGAVFLLLTCVLASSQAGADAQSGAPTSAQIQAHFQRAEEDLKANDPQSAMKEYDAILALDPKNAEAHTNRGALEFLQGDCSTASRDFRDALAANRSLARAKGMLGICESREGDRDAQRTLEGAYAEVKEKHLRTQVGLQLAGIFFQQGDIERAAQMAQSLVDMSPDDIEVLYMAQLVYSELADVTLNKFTILAAGTARMQQVIAEHLVNAGNLKEAIAHYQKCLEMDPRIPGVRFELAEAILGSARSDPSTQAQAESVLEQAMKAEGDSAQIESEFGRIALLQSDNQTAYARYAKALAMDPGDADAQIGMGHALMSLGKPEEAVKYLRRAVAADPLNSEAHYRLGTAYRMLHLEIEAERELTLFEEIKKTNTQVKELYREMNKKARFPDEGLSIAPQ